MITREETHEQLLVNFYAQKDKLMRKIEKRIKKGVKEGDGVVRVCAHQLNCSRYYLELLAIEFDNFGFTTTVEDIKTPWGTMFRLNIVID